LREGPLPAGGRTRGPARSQRCGSHPRGEQYARRGRRQQRRDRRASPGQRLHARRTVGAAGVAGRPVHGTHQGLCRLPHDGHRPGGQEMRSTMPTITAAVLAGPSGRQSGDTAAHAGEVVRSEWCKLRSVRSTWWALAAALVFNVLTAALLAVFLPRALSAREQAAIDAVRVSLGGLHLSQVAFGLLGVLIITGEYGSGM